jgi:hypothetical protein
VPSQKQPILFDPETSPQLVVLIDIEEEFDWDEDFDRQATETSHLTRLQGAIDVFQRFGIVPVGVCTYPVAAQGASAAIIEELVSSGRMVAGAHLHPWVTPPHDEPLERRLSFPGNLPRELEAAKLSQLTEAISLALGTRPQVYQAGRYGLGPATRELLREQGYLVDMSVCPPFDYSSEDGPDYSRESNHPTWHGSGETKLLSLPVTGAFVGASGRWAPALFKAASKPSLSWAHLPGVLARTGLAERLRLSPEGQTVSDMRRLTTHLYSQGCRVFNFSFHSPTLLPGSTSYVRSEADAEDFLQRLSQYFEWFLGDFAGRSTTPLALHQELSSAPTDRGL